MGFKVVSEGPELDTASSRFRVVKEGDGPVVTQERGKKPGLGDIAISFLQAIQRPSREIVQPAMQKYTEKMDPWLLRALPPNPLSALLPITSDPTGLLRKLPITGQIRRAEQKAQGAVAGEVARTATNPVDVATLLLAPQVKGGRMVQGALGGLAGLASALGEDEVTQRSVIERTVAGLGLGAAFPPHTPPKALAVPRRPGFAPESVLIPAERVSAQEAASAAREGFETMVRPKHPMTGEEILSGYGVKSEAAPRSSLLRLHDEYLKLAKGSRISQAERMEVVGKLRPSEVELLKAPSDIARVSRKVIKHIVENHSPDAEYVIENMPRVVSAPDQVFPNPNPKKHPESFFFVKKNGRNAMIVLEVKRNTKSLEVVSGRIMGEEELGKLIGGSPTVPSFGPTSVGSLPPTVVGDPLLAASSPQSTTPKSVPPSPGIVKPTKFKSNRGFLALPEDEGVEKAAAQAAARSVVPVVSEKTKFPQELPPESQGRAQRVLDALRTAKPVRREQEALYSADRARRMARAIGTRERVGGEQGYYAELGQLKGELPKVQYESLRPKIEQVDVDGLMDDINRSLGFWDSLPAKSGLIKMLGGTVPTHGEITALQKVFGPEMAKELLAKRPLIERMKQFGIELLNLPRSMSAGLGDLSASLRQAVFVAPSHPVKWGKAFLNQFPQFASEEAFQASQKQIASRPSYDLMRQHNLALTDVGGALTEQEERFMAQNLIERIPLLKTPARMTNRAYVGMLNRLRADLFDDYVKSAQTLKLDEKAQALMLDHAANFINSATGRGALRVPIFGGVEGTKGLERSAVLLNSTFFSPRLMASRLNLLDPTYYVRLQPQVRKEALKSLAAFVGVGATTLTILKANGVNVGDDPRSADFGKIKTGNTRYDIWGGFQQPVRAMAQMITGKMISSTTGRESIIGEGYKPTTRLDILTRYFQSKESPVASFVTDWLTGKSSSGEPFRPGPEILDRFIPMVLQDMHDLSQEENASSWWKALPSVFGVGVQTYGKQIPMKEKTPSGAEKIGFRSPPSLGERIVNKATGKQVSDIPKELHPQLERARMNELTRKAEIDKAKRLTIEDGKTRRVGKTTVFLKDGVVKTKTTGRIETPEKLYKRSR